MDARQAISSPKVRALEPSAAALLGADDGDSGTPRPPCRCAAARARFAAAAALALRCTADVRTKQAASACDARGVQVSVHMWARRPAEPQRGLGQKRGIHTGRHTHRRPVPANMRASSRWLKPAACSSAHTLMSGVRRSPPARRRRSWYIVRKLTRPQAGRAAECRAPVHGDVAGEDGEHDGSPRERGVLRREGCIGAGDEAEALEDGGLALR